MFKRYVSSVLAAVIGATQAKQPITNQAALQALAHAEFNQASTSYEQLMFAGITLQDLNQLTDVAKAQGCQSLTKVQKSSSGQTIRETYNQAEVFRLFNCPNLQQEVERGVFAILSTPDFKDKLKNADDLFYAYMIYKKQEEYTKNATKQGDALVDYLVKSATEEWLNSKAGINMRFDALTWQFQGQGFSESTTRLVQMLSSLMVDNEKIRTKAEKELGAAFDKLHETAYFSGKNQAFYVTQSMPMNVLEINYHLFMAERLFTNKSSSKSNSSFVKDTMKRQQYFATKAQLATTVEQAAYSLEGLKEIQQEAPFMIYSGQNGVFNFVDYLGQPMTTFPSSVDEFKLVRLLDYQMGSTQLTQDDFSVKNGELKVLGDKFTGRHWLQVETQKGVIKCADAMIKSDDKQNTITKVKYTHKDEEGTISKREGLPIKQATDGEVLKLVYKQADGAVPFSSVYLRVIKTDFQSEKQVPFSKRGNPESRQLKFNFDELNLINGDYEFTLVGVTNEGIKTEFPLGSVNVWFKEGNPEMVNDGVHEDYLPKPEIVAQFNAPDEHGSNMKPFVFCGLIAFCALVFVISLLNLGPNSKNVTFSGVLAMGAVIGVMGIITGFWFGQANLIQTLWLMAPLSLIWLFVVSNGIVASTQKD